MKQRNSARAAWLAAGAMAAISGAAWAQEQPAEQPSAPQAPPQHPSTAPVVPLWEFRLGGTALYAPDYPAAEEYQWRGIGAPLFIYRGKRLRLGAEDPNAIARAIAAETRRFELDLSADANFGADSDDNEARRGMPDLDAQLEIGPQLTINLGDSGWDIQGRRRVRLLLPVRGMAASDLSQFEHLGYVFQPTLAYRRQWAGERQTSFSSWFSLTFATEGVHDYYYEVAPEFVTPERPAYDAKGGFLGAHWQISGRHEVRPDLHLFLTYRLRSLAGAANEDSPLHREDITHAFSVSFVWTAARSDRPAQDGG